ncbi:MAG: amidohydrolase family protein [Bacteroidales bacterium]|nr:amidohydrolase family protein [Bacteroidales bacterium]
MNQRGKKDKSGGEGTDQPGKKVTPPGNADKEIESPEFPIPTVVPATGKGVRSITAPLVYTLWGPPLENGRVFLDDQGTIMAVTPRRQKVHFPVREEVVYTEGVLVPGFVNVHCHLELSHLAGVIPGGTGIGGFIGAINRRRGAPEEEMVQAARHAASSMYHSGTVAVGDISNTALTAPLKKESPMTWITFVESFGFHPSRAERALQQALAVWEVFASQGMAASIVPHSPYSVSDPLMRAIAELDQLHSSRLSLHNQESSEEDLFFRRGEGAIRAHLTENLGLDVSHWIPTGLSSLESTLPKLPASKPLLLIHNTFTTSTDLAFLRKIRTEAPTWLVLCPNSNLYIGGNLPPVPLFRREGVPLCLGTDSLASNHGLSLFDEVVTLHRFFPEIPAQELFTWACLNGARALGLSHRLGSLEAGKQPGLVLITPGQDNHDIFMPGSRLTRLA